MAFRRNLLLRSALLCAAASGLLALGAGPALAQMEDATPPKIAPSVDKPSLYGASSSAASSRSSVTGARRARAF